MERSRGQTRSKTPACDLTTSYAYDFSPRKVEAILVDLKKYFFFQSRDERNWRIIHNEWGPEPAMTDMRETKGHLNWGLWERKKARMTAEADVRKSDYQSHFKGSLEKRILQDLFGRLEASSTNSSESPPPRHSFSCNL